MTCVLLVRHAEHILQNERLLGRTHEAGFSEAGEAQLNRLAEVLADERPDVVYTSPRLRALNTAYAIATRSDLPVQIHDELDELDYGEWSGRRFDDLANDPGWQLWNSQRSRQCPPGGESMQQLQARMVAWLTSIGKRHPGRTIACVSHAEPIRALLLHICGRPLDEFASVDVPPGTMTKLHLASRAGRPELSLGAMSA